MTTKTRSRYFNFLTNYGEFATCATSRELAFVELKAELAIERNIFDLELLA